MSILLVACQPNGGETELAGSVQGTTYHIKWAHANPDLKIEDIRKNVEDIFARIDVKLSNWRQDSEISALNRAKTTAWLPVSPEIAELIAIARVVHEKSAGCYDLTVKPIFDLWGFSRHENRVPTAEEIAAVLPHIGLDKLELDAENLRIRKRDPELAIDLSSIAQGYTVGAVARYLEGLGIQNYLAEIGGEMKVKGRKANGDEWRVAVEKPTPFTREVQKILSIHQQNGVAIMTSGTYRNFFEQQGHVYSHILDPKTGKPVTHHLLSDTVLHEDPTWADAWSTALLCLGEEEGARVAEAEKLRVLFISGENGQLKERLSSELEKNPDGAPAAP
ncbi:FAD:protein FMN transferase [Methylococcus sp. EFPC2]|uniref:FAD:protein FMN transferase n=1 Tax=Methylococcus sp. EFPC2 TaxID=2812648 RepID=UPI001F079B78|nr:FAD:protein FMN transferase [Methylococcus sp. EFPC2]